MSPQRFGRLSLIAILHLGLGIIDASGQSTGKRTFSTSANCELSDLLTPDQCQNAHTNALAELDEKSPRFPARGECEKNFKQCMIAGFDRKQAEFEPALRGFEVTVRSSTDKSVLPVIDGDSSSLGFHARSALRPDAGISHSLRQQAQARWTQAQKARAAAEASASRPPGERREPGDGPQDWPTAKEPVAAPAPLTDFDLKSAERRREEFRKAPTVY